MDPNPKDKKNRKQLPPPVLLKRQLVTQVDQKPEPLKSLAEDDQINKLFQPNQIEGIGGRKLGLDPGRILAVKLNGDVKVNQIGDPNTDVHESSHALAQFTHLNDTHLLRPLGKQDHPEKKVDPLGYKMKPIARFPRIALIGLGF